MTQEKSTQIQNLEAQPPIGIPTTDWKGVKRIMRFTFTQGGANGPVGSTAELVRLPAGNIRVLLEECHMHRTAFGASGSLDIGWQAYSKPDGTTVDADADALVDGLNVVSAGDGLWGASSQGAGSGVDADKSFLIESKSGVTVQATVAGGNIPAGAKLTGYVTYVQD